MTIYHIHIRKTGGGTMKAALRPYLASHDITLWPHAKTLAEVPADARALFGIRDPVSRFVSGFNSRLRQGLPKKHIPWKPDEAWAFARFKTAYDLAEALASDNVEARQAMGSITHVKHPYRDTFGSAAALRARADDVVMVMHQPDLAQDFDTLKRLIKLPPDARLTDDPVQAHRTPPGYSTTLSDRGEAAIRDWYAQDIAIYEAALEIRRAILARSGA